MLSGAAEEAYETGDKTDYGLLRKPKECGGLSREKEETNRAVNGGGRKRLIKTDRSL